MESNTAKYRILGLVEITNEQGDNLGAYEVGSVHEFPVEQGTKLLEEGKAELVMDNESDSGSGDNSGETAENTEKTGETDESGESGGSEGEDL